MSLSLFECAAHLFASSPVDSTAMADSLWVIVALPLAGALVCGVFGRMLGRGNTQLIACSAVAGSFVLSLLAFWAVNDSQTVLRSPFARQPIAYALGRDFGVWFSAGEFRTNFGLVVDHLSGTMILVVSGVS